MKPTSTTLEPCQLVKAAVSASIKVRWTDRPKRFISKPIRRVGLGILTDEESTMKKFAIFAVLCVAYAMMQGCSDATLASYNLSRSAMDFQLERRIVFYNGITDSYILVVEGRCSVETQNDLLAVTCKTGLEEFKMHYLGLSDNVTFFSEQLKAVDVNTYHYKVYFKPASIIPDVDVRL